MAKQSARLDDHNLLGNLAFLARNKTLEKQFETFWQNLDDSLRHYSSLPKSSLSKLESSVQNRLHQGFCEGQQASTDSLSEANALSSTSARFYDSDRAEVYETVYTRKWGITSTSQQARCMSYFLAINELFEDENENKFIKFYEERQFPLRVVNSTARRNIEWLVNPAQLSMTESLDLVRKLSYGLSTFKQPYSMIAMRAFQDLISLNNAPMIFAQTLTETVPNIRKGLSSPSIPKRMEMLDLLQRIAAMQDIGLLLVPFYRILLPPLRRCMPTQISDSIKVTERDRYNEAISTTLNELERNGGRHAYINIKYVIPDYQSFKCSN